MPPDDIKTEPPSPPPPPRKPLREIGPESEVRGGPEAPEDDIEEGE